MTSRATLAAMVALVAVGAAGLGVAQDGYPSRTIRLVVGFSAGGPTDLPARLIAEKIGDALGRRLTVENKTGAGGMLATRDVLAQEADGHTLLLCTHFESINIAAYRNPGYKLDEIAPISLIAKYYYALALAPAVPASTFEEFVQYAKAHPGELNYATIGTGSAQEILARQIEGLTGIKLNKVPFRLSSQIITDMISGRVHLYFAPTLGSPAVLSIQAAQGSCDVESRAPEQRTRRACPERERARVRPVRLARHLRQERHAATDHRRAQSTHRVGGGSARLPGQDHRRRIDPGLVDASGAEADHRQDAGGCGLHHS
jgi:Tripartite tricarboxylate transporter family receptor